MSGRRIAYTKGKSEAASYKAVVEINYLLLSEKKSVKKFLLSAFTLLNARGHISAAKGTSKSEHKREAMEESLREIK